MVRESVRRLDDALGRHAELDAVIAGQVRPLNVAVIVIAAFIIVDYFALG
jgi:hypothetical protein